MITEGKPCKCIIYLWNLFAKLEAELYSNKEIKCTIFENRLTTTKNKESPSKQGKLETKSMEMFCQGTACIFIGYSLPPGLLLSALIC